MDLKALALCGLGRHREAAGLLETAARKFRTIEDRFGILFTLVALGRALLRLGDAAGARAALAEALAISSALVQPWGIAHARHGLADVEAAEGNAIRAADMLASSLDLRLHLEDRKGVLECLESASDLLARAGMPREAAELLGASSAIRERIGASLPPAERERDSDRRRTLIEALGDEDFRAALAAGSSLDWKGAAARARELRRAWVRGSGSPAGSQDR
jgi:hypothetical protein